MNLTIEDFIPSYPIQHEEDFMEKMVVKEEIRELLRNPTSPYYGNEFWRSYQMVTARIIAPWTGAKSFFIRHDVGLGKTRQALAVITTYMENSNYTKALIIASGAVVLKAFVDEMVSLIGYDKVLATKKFITTGKKAHGKSISSTRKFKSEGLDKRTPVLVNHIASDIGIGEYMESIITNYHELVRMDPEDIPRDMEDLYERYTQLRDEIRERYKNHVIVIDEAHILKESVTTIKKSHALLLILLDSVRDICPILIMTATPIVDTWKDLMSVLGLLYPPDQRDEMEDDMKGIEDEDIPEVVKKWARGKVSDRTSRGLVPANVPMPGTHKYTIVLEDEDTTNEVVIDDNIYPTYMSEFQTLYTATCEATGSAPSYDEITNTDAISDEAGVYSWRKYYDFVPPVISEDIDVQEAIGKSVETKKKTVVRHMNISELVTLTDRGVYQPSKASYIYGNYSVFDVVRNDDGTVSTDQGLGKHSSKYTDLINLLESDTLKDMAGYVHTVWVEYGTKMIAAALVANGWEQYTGIGELSSSTTPRFAVIHGENTTTTNINNIIDIFNGDNNRNGSVLRLIVGSRKSGIGLSFTNAQFFVELSSSFNKSSKIQAEGRVFRISSIEWMGINRRIYTAVFMAFPSRINENYEEDIDNYMVKEEYYYALSDGGKTVEVSPYTIEMKLEYLAQSKHNVADIAMDALREVSVETIYEENISKKTDFTTYNIIYSKPEVRRMKSNIQDIISHKWSIPFPSSMIGAKAVASLVSDSSLVVNNYGIPNPVRDLGNMITSYKGGRETHPMSIAYSTSFFVTYDERTYGHRSIEFVVKAMRDSPTDEYDFYEYVSNTLPTVTRTILLELTLSTDPSITSSEDRDIIESRRELVLSLYKDVWNVFDPNILVHILPYVILATGYISRLGITTNPQGKSRYLPYSGSTHSTMSTWMNETNTSIESLYLSWFSMKIREMELNVIERTKDLGFYVHFSLADGMIRVRHAELEDLRRSRFYLPTDPVVTKFIETVIGESIVGMKTETISRKLFYTSKEKGYLVIR